MRPLFYDFYNDLGSATVDDQQMFGPVELKLALALFQYQTMTSLALPFLPTILM